jgi:tripartite-type tricarboxylate transporter receptor subunit TctC
MTWLRRSCAVLLMAGLCTGTVVAQIFPTKPVRIVVPFPPGGGVDLIARLVGSKLAESLGQPFLVENRAGAGGNIGTAAVAKAAPDGYTVLMTTSGHAISPALYRKLPFDAVKDFEPVTQVTATYLILVVNSNVPASSAKELIALAMSQPGRLNYASTGVGGTPHLAMELFKLATGTNIVHVPYAGNAAADAAVVANVVQMVITPLGGVLPHIKSGGMRALAVTGNTRSPLAPDVPTMVQAGVKDYVFTTWLGLLAPARTPREIRSRLQAEIAKVVALPEIGKQLGVWGHAPVGNTPDEFDAMFKTDLAQYARIIKEARIPQQD